MRMISLIRSILCPALMATAVATGAENDQPRDERAGIEYFELHIRPLLVERCYECHSSESDPIEGGLRLDSRSGWQAGGDSGPAVVPGKPNESRLLKAVLYQDPTLAMPPDNALSKREIELLHKWIEIGAPDPRSEANQPETSAPDFEIARQFWSFRAVVEPVPPTVMNEDWVQSPIDRFVLSRLEENHLTPVQQASKNVLIRRAYLDLLGLPPTPDEVTEFLDDESIDAWPRLVDRLLASPHYGERWGRHWLDVARYADDQLRTEYYYRDLPHAWRYRDWVVQALNDDLPYDRFVLQQLAGDLLVEEFGLESTAATGFIALGMIYQSDGNTPEGLAVAESETLDDRVNTVTQGLLGLTVSCARCHDHKFDPVPTEDYYSLAGIFRNAKYAEDAPLASQDVVEQYCRAQQEISQVKEQFAEAEKAKDGDMLAVLQAELARQEQAAPPIFPQAHALLESGNVDMRVALRGNLLKPGPIAPRRFLRVLAGDERPQFAQGSGRLQLARAIASPQNPLTARVIVNRIWQHHFGNGIVTSASNFGVLGEPPTHPELLDWLAARFLATGWSIKGLHREILLSSTYQLSSQYDEHNDRIDGGNRWLWRMNRRRLDVESIRDSLLAVSGELDRRIGGPPEIDLLASRRRTIYGAVRRDTKSDADELLRTFDFPNPRISSSGRSSTTIPQQQLFFLNSTFMIERAHALALRVTDLPENTSDAARIRHVFLLVFGREASREELDLADSFFAADAAEGSTESQTRLEQFCQVLMSSNDFLFIP
ncbi:MAG: PSD1 and planctomycete cytochrome C domain-containing protein [Planctomycetaceae bacterium]